MRKLKQYLTRSTRAARAATYVDVGFLADAVYPDGTSVPAVAYVNEFGKKGQPPRPFFRKAIAENEQAWRRKLAKLMEQNDMDARKSLTGLGVIVQGSIQKSINDLMSPPLAPSTVKAKGFDKPLIDTGVMLRSVDFEVK